jgi:hypothetical protein
MAMIRSDLAPLEPRCAVTIEARPTFTLFVVVCQTCSRVWKLRSTSPVSKVAHVLDHVCRSQEISRG